MQRKISNNKIVHAAILTSTATALAFGTGAANATLFPPGIGGKIPAVNPVGFDEPILFLEPDPLAALAGLVDDVGATVGTGGAYGKGVRETFAADGVIDPKE